MQEIANKADFETKVIKNSKPVLVDFFAEWCGPCKRLGPIIEEFAKEKAEKMDAYKLDIDQVGDVAAEFSVQSIPTLILFQKGKELDRQLGFMPKTELKKWVDGKIS